MTLLTIHPNCILTDAESGIFANVGMARGLYPYRCHASVLRIFIPKRQALRMIMVINSITYLQSI
jgi:hypothetical protein